MSRFIKFKTTSYELASQENVSASRLQATILKDDHTVENILGELEGTTTATVTEDDEVVAVYNGYTDVLAVTVMTNQLIDISTDTYADTVSIELLNADMQSQIDSLQSVQAAHSDAIEANYNAIASINDEIDNKLDSSVVGNEETIGSPSKHPYEVGDTFIGTDGKFYKATSPIMIDSILVIGGNCEETKISAEISEEV